MIEVNCVSKSYGDFKAVEGLDLVVQRGETFALLGPNGAGKSTTIGMLVGLMRPDSGSIRIDQRDPMLPTTRTMIGVAPQALAVYEELTALENLRFFASLYNDHSRIDWCLEFSGLKSRANHRVSTFSGGMKRRLNIAIAVVNSPQVLLLDEPTVGVDPQSRNHIFDCISQLQDDGMTIIYTTHYMEEVERLCKRVAIMDHGKLMAIGTVDELLERHGGDSKVSAEISNVPTGVDLPGIVNDGVLEFHSAEPLETTLRLNRAGVEFRTLNVRRPDLESVFLSLTGRNLRD
ncbi:MAG: ABC transporter ATP-binding protein [Pirellulaceae bacterium]